MRVTLVSNGRWSVRGEDPRMPSVTVMDYGNDYECSEHGFISEEPAACVHMVALLDKKADIGAKVSIANLAFIVCECCLVLVPPGRGLTCRRCRDHETRGIVCRGSKTP